MPNMRISLTLAVLLLASCATLEREEVAAPANGGTVAMRVGSALVVSLPPDPDTVSGWVVRSVTPNLVTAGGPDYTPQPKPPGLVGVADTATFRFRAREIGNGTIELAWLGPPGAAPQPDRVVRYDVVVGPRLWLASDYFGTVGLGSARAADASSGSAPAVK